MGKLLELLNEYSELKGERLTEEEGQPIRKRHDYELEYPIEKIRIISKQYGFIKWLVENDKIDRDKNVLAFVFSSVFTYDGEDYEDYLKECKLLMLLAIQDEPIRFLCDILK